MNAKNFFLILFLCISALSIPTVNAHGGEKINNPRHNKKYGCIFISVNVHNCRTNTTDSTHVIRIPKKWNLGMLKLMLEEQPTTKIQIEQFIFSKRYVSNSDTFEDLEVKNLDTIIALGDSKKLIKPNSIYIPPKHSRSLDIQKEDYHEQYKAEALIRYKELIKLHDLDLIKMELNPYMFRKFVYQEQEFLENTPINKSPSLNLDYEKLSGPSEEPLPVTWQF